MNIADWPNGMKFIQSDSQFKLTTDSVLLAHFAANSKVRKICEPCCGIGGIAILLAGHIPHAHISCLEFQEEAALLAKENVEINGLSSRCLLYTSTLLRNSGLKVRRRSDITASRMLS